MRTFGNINFQQNEIQQAVIQVEKNLPETPKAGRLAFKDRVLYICAEIQEGVPAWIPLTNELGMHVFYQNTTSSTWTIRHNLNASTPAVQVYNDGNKLVTPDNIELVSSNEVVVSFTQPVAGRAVILVGTDEGATRETGPFVHQQTQLSATWVISHGFGYFPLVRIFIGDQEVQPAAIQHPTNFETIVTFTTPQVGTARLA